MLFSEAKFFISDPSVMPAWTTGVIAVNSNGSKKITTSSENENKTKKNHLSCQRKKQGHQATVQTEPPHTNKQRCLSGLKGKKMAQL